MEKTMDKIVALAKARGFVYSPIVIYPCILSKGRCLLGWRILRIVPANSSIHPFGLFKIPILKHFFFVKKEVKQLTSRTNYLLMHLRLTLKIKLHL